MTPDLGAGSCQQPEGEGVDPNAAEVPMSQVDPDETQLMDVENEQGTGALAMPGSGAAGVIVDDDGMNAWTSTSTEGHQGQTDLKHWLK